MVLNYIRHILFYFMLGVWSSFIGVFILFSLFFPSFVAVFIARMWARGVLFLLKYIIRLSVRVEGSGNIPGYPAVYASKHQSVFETIFFFAYLPRITYVLKRELLFIPLFGIGLWKTGQIAIKRSKGRQSLNLLINIGRNRIKRGYSLVIFPEGTRTPYQVKVSHYKAGVYSFAKAFDVEVVPVALNSGKFWPRKSFFIKKGEVVVSFLKPLSVAQYSSKDRFLSRLNQVIESQSLSL